jgi:hypothetical protein
VVGLGLDNS